MYSKIRILSEATISSTSPTERKPVVQFPVNILAAKKLAKEILQASPKIHIIPFARPASPTQFVVQPIVVTPVMAAPPVDPINVIIAARYAPLVLPNNLNAFPTTDYMKYLPRYNGEGEVTAEEHFIAFYNFANNFAIEHSNVWMRLFAQSLDGEVRKWFRSLTANSIPNIAVLDATFIRKWGEKKDDLYYVTEFNNLKRKNGESVSDFSQRFNKMYQKIPVDIKPTESLAKITYADSFDADFCFLLGERRSPTLANTQDATLEVESNILAADSLKKRSDKGKQKEEHKPSSSSQSKFHKNSMEELVNKMEAMSTELVVMRAKRKNFNKSNNHYKRPNNPQRDNQDQRISTPFQNNCMYDEEGEEEEDQEPNINFFEGIGREVFLTQEDYQIRQ